MTTYTKRVTIKYASNEDRDGPSAFTDARFSKGQEMTTAGKTDGLISRGVNSSTTRKFTDQTAAEEYLNFILESAQANGVTIVESSITDY
jgi:hypothetical protein